MGESEQILIVNNAEPGITEFTSPLKKIVEKLGFTPVIIEYEQCPGFDFSGIKGVILSGSPQGNDIVEHHLPYFEWMKNIGKPVFGICAGHHISGFMNGSEILRGKEPESGDFWVSVIKKDELLDGLPDKLKVKQMHNDSVALPKNFDLLITSETCKNQLMKHKNKPWYTCQFHPEYYNHDLIKNFLKICKK
jgi:GMP synthase (glutamine-hydrolysing)